ncbi:hypothetical protein BDB01DRAFT_415429 [Pilobolus umbonatus]|nr:hypothetical protein BDB01DRAFT_415429 [Pilobolus umbonatus]
MYNDYSNRPHSMVHDSLQPSSTRKIMSVPMTPISEHHYLDIPTTYYLNNTPGYPFRHHSLYIPSTQTLLRPNNMNVLRRSNTSRSNHTSSRGNHNNTASRNNSSSSRNNTAPRGNINVNMSHISDTPSRSKNSRSAVAVDDNIPLALLAYQKGYISIYPSLSMSMIDGVTSSYTSISSSSEDSSSSQNSYHKIVQNQKRTQPSCVSNSIPQLAKTPHLQNNKTPQNHSNKTPQNHSNKTPQYHSNKTPQYHSNKTPQYYINKTPQSSIISNKTDISNKTSSYKPLRLSMTPQSSSGKSSKENPPLVKSMSVSQTTISPETDKKKRWFSLNIFSKSKKK